MSTKAHVLAEGWGERTILYPDYGCGGMVNTSVIIHEAACKYCVNLLLF